MKTLNVDLGDRSYQSTLAMICSANRSWLSRLSPARR